MGRPDETVFDRALDRMIPLGYSRLGFELRSRSWSTDDPAPNALSGRRALVTGAAGGIGEATALGLARLGATVHLLGRSIDRVEPAVARITAQLAAERRSAQLEPEACDVSSLVAIKRFSVDLVSRLAASDTALDVVVHNAGVMPGRRMLSDEGHELAAATHVIGPLALTEALRPQLGAAGESRVIFVSSGGMYAQRIHADDFEYARGRYRGAAAYARSKRMQVELLGPLAEHWSAQGIRVLAMHPGWVDTPGIASSLPGFSRLVRPILRDSAAGADTIAWLAATQPAPRSGSFWSDRTERPTSYISATRPSSAERAALWAWAATSSGLEVGG
ncbi:MAG: SDR family NAD(P)-dependent oxidoreductase [Solirubrobacterales bacterium]